MPKRKRKGGDLLDAAPNVVRLPDILPFEPAGFEPVQRMEASAVSIVPRLGGEAKPRDADQSFDRVQQLARDIVEINRACAVLSVEERAARRGAAQRRRPPRTPESLPIIIGSIIGLLVVSVSALVALFGNLAR